MLKLYHVIARQKLHTISYTEISQKVTGAVLKKSHRVSLSRNVYVYKGICRNYMLAEDAGEYRSAWELIKS